MRRDILDEIASYHVPVIVGPIYEAPRSDERYDAVYSLPAELQKRGVKIAFSSLGGSGDVRNLPYAAGYAVAYGLPYNEALKAITLNPRRCLAWAIRWARWMWGRQRTSLSLTAIRWMFGVRSSRCSSMGKWCRWRVARRSCAMSTCRSPRKSKVAVRCLPRRELTFACFDTDDFAVSHVQDPVCDGSGFGVVRDHQHCLFQLSIGTRKHFEHCVRILAVEIAGRLVGQHNGRMRDQCSRKRDTLLLPAGELGWTVLEASADTEQRRQVLQIGAIERGLCGRRFRRLFQYFVLP